MKQKKSDSVNFDTLENPEELELKHAFKTFSKVLGIIWGFCFVILIIVPLFDFKGNQFIVSSAYYFVLIGLIYFLFLEFSFQYMFNLYKDIMKKFKQAQ